MSNKVNSARLRDQVYGQWTERSPERRKHADTEAFIDDLWYSGVRLGSSSSLHYQHVMDVIRAKITDQEKPLKIRYVEPDEWGKVEGRIADMPWLVAHERFISFFKDERRARGLYEHVEEKHGCRAWNAKDWSVAMNSVITILNTLPDNASEDEATAAFGL